MTIRSASSTRRWLSCGLSVRLPQEKDQPGPAAIIGTRFHALVEKAIDAGKWVDLEPLDEHFSFALKSTLDWFNSQIPGNSQILTEQAYEIQPLGHYEHVEGRREPAWRERMQCRALPKTGGHRDYPNKPGCIYGTADVVVTVRVSVHVYDWKTGQKSDDHEAQLATLALAAAEAHGVEHATASAVYVNLKSGKVTPHTRIFDTFDLHIHASQIVAKSIEHVADKMPWPVPGKYCFFCPAIGCPEKLRNHR